MEKVGEILKRVAPSVTASRNPSVKEFTCTICQDSGMVHPRDGFGRVVFSQVVPCVCQRERIETERKARLLEFCRLPADTESWTLDSFNAYTPELKKALAAAREITSLGGRLKWLVLMSKVDRGKSHLAVGICREWLKRDTPARYVFVPDLLDELRSGYEREDDHSFLSMMHFYKTVPLLIMDDLGSEKPSPWVVEKLTTIINHRAENGLHLLVTTNKELDELPGDADHRIGSRLRRYREGKVIVIKDAGEYSLRLKGER